MITHRQRSIIRNTLLKGAGISSLLCELIALTYMGITWSDHRPSFSQESELKEGAV